MRKNKEALSSIESKSCRRFQSMNVNASYKKSPLKFFLLVFALALPFWLLGFLVKTQGLPMNLPISAFQFVCPLIAALILVYREEKSAGVKKLLKRAFDYKRIKHKIWFVPIILLNPLIMLLSYWVMLLLGRPIHNPFIPWSMIPIFFVLFFFAALCEEVGWMGYAIDPMQERWSALTAGSILGLVWAAFHIIPWLSANPPLWVVGQSINTVALRILIVWLYNNNGKSILAGILFHDMLNVSEFAFPNYGSYYDPVIGEAITVVIAVIVAFLWGAKTLARFRYAHSSEKQAYPEKR